MKDYWIGDWVKLLSTGQTGKFEGMINGKAKIKTDRDLILAKIEDLEKLPDEFIPDEEQLIADTGKKIKKIKSVFKNSLDLHIYKLNPSMENEIPELILAFQLKKARFFIEEAIKRKQYSIIMIHGKGLGSLKMEIEHLLQNYSELNYFITANDGGATQAFFKYY